MAVTRKEELAKRVRLANLALQLNQQKNPQNLNTETQSSSATRKRKREELLHVNDKAIVKRITSGLAKASQTPNVTDDVVAATLVKHIVLPMPLSTEQDAEKKMALDDILPPEILDLIVDYRPFAYVDAKQKEKLSNNTSANNSYKAPKASFFGKNLSLILHQAANDILDGNQAKVDRVVALVKNNPALLLSPTEGCDRLGRRVQGTLLQIAAMAGDVNLREFKEEEKQHRGIVELLQEAGNFSKEDVTKQLHPVLFSGEAIKANNARNERILAAVKQFGESILQADIAKIPQPWSVEIFRVAQKKCEPAIKAFRATLQSTLNDVVVSGYVFDLSILHQAMTWFKEKNNLGSLMTLASDVFWINGIGSLQCVASSRDAQVFRKGIGNVVKHHQMPERGLKEAGGFSLFVLSTSGLGVDLFLGFYDGACDRGMWAGEIRLLVGRLMLSKNSSVAKFMLRSDKQPVSWCLIQ